MARVKKPSLPPRPNAHKTWDTVPAEDSPECERLAAMLPHIADKEAFRNDLLTLSYGLSLDLYDCTHFEPKKVRKELDRLHAKLESALSALRTLSEEAKSPLASRAFRQSTRDSHCQWIEPQNVGQKGDLLLQWVDRALADCTRWAAEARANVDIPRVIVDDPDPDDPTARPRRRGGGRPPSRDAREAIRNLAWLWEKQTGKKPTIITNVRLGTKGGPFIDFCKAVILPIYAGFGVPALDIGSLAQNVLYPPKSGEFG